MKALAAGGDGNLNNLMSFNQTNYNLDLTALTWQTLYVGVFRANQVIAYVPAIDMDADIKSKADCGS